MPPGVASGGAEADGEEAGRPLPDTGGSGGGFGVGVEPGSGPGGDGDDRTIAEGAQRAVAGQTSDDTLDSALDYMAHGRHGSGGLAAAPGPKSGGTTLAAVPRGGRSLAVLVGLAVVLFLALKEPASKNRQRRGRPAGCRRRSRQSRKVDDAWLKQVAAMPAEKQVEAVAAKLKELNPGFDGKVTHKIEDGVVTELEFLTDNVTDISPVRALTGLTNAELQRQCSSWGKGTAGRPVAAEGHEADEPELRLHAGVRPVAAEGHEADDPGLLQHAGVRPVAAEGHEADAPALRRHAGVRPVAAEGHETDGPGLPQHAGVRPVAAEGHEADGPELRLARKVSDLSPLKGMPLKELSVRLQARARHRDSALHQDAGDDQRQTGEGVLEGSGRQEAGKEAMSQPTSQLI